MNRAPGKSDSWWATHEAECGGTYTKIQEPELTKKQRGALSKKERAGLQKNKLDTWVKVERKKTASTDVAVAENPLGVAEENTLGSKGLGAKREAQTFLLDDVVESGHSKRSKLGSGKTKGGEDEDPHIPGTLTDPVECPICSQRVEESDINEHLDLVHPP
jgi:hypothetical protein